MAKKAEDEALGRNGPGSQEQRTQSSDSSTTTEEGKKEEGPRS